SAVLSRLRTTHFVALAIDLPRMNGEHLKKLQRSAKSGCGVIPSVGKNFEPLCAIYPAEAAAAAKLALAGNDVSMQNLVGILIRQQLLQPYVPTREEVSFYQNINTPADFAASDTG